MCHPPCPDCRLAARIRDRRKSKKPDPVTSLLVSVGIGEMVPVVEVSSHVA